jgi:cytochrome c oxidase subunit 2
MRLHRLVLPVFILSVVALAAVAAQEPVPAVKEIAITAKKYEYIPNKIEVPVGTAVRFKITAEDNEHGFEIEGVKDSCVEIPKGETKTVDYKATKTGVVNFKCCHFCGMGHGRMKGTLTVK